MYHLSECSAVDDELDSNDHNLKKPRRVNDFYLIFRLFNVAINVPVTNVFTSMNKRFFYLMFFCFS